MTEPNEIIHTWRTPGDLVADLLMDPKVAKTLGGARASFLKDDAVLGESQEDFALVDADNKMIAFPVSIAARTTFKS